ncbi:MAG: hypothetical protein FWH37_06125 [Candidatus Bathyarchaeota archaeon]|nr:hypothetical protein [Candidatus Termiticorpusculum sp.]
MKNWLVKKFAILLVLLIVTSVTIFSNVTVADQVSQEKTMNFMEQVLPIDLSKYTINLKTDITRDGTPPLFDDNRKVTDMLYELRSESSSVDITFSVENGAITYCHSYPIEGQVITNKQYTTLHDAIVDSLKTYQTYTETDLNNLITIIDNVDLTTDTTITTENTKLTISTSFWVGINYITFKWAQVINGAEYPVLSFRFDGDSYVLLAVNDSGAPYTIGDTAVNISEKQAVAIAVESLKHYSYEMVDGSIVKDIDVSNYGWVAELVVAPVDFVDYELRPYWDVRVFLDNVYSGNVFAFSVLIWANTGEVISCGNMAPGGTYNVDDINYVDSGSTFYNTQIVVVVVAVTVVVLVVSILFKKRYK